MSVMLKARLLWVLPLAMFGSWLAVRTLTASTIGAAATDPPPSLLMSSTTTAVAARARVEVKDTALTKHITRLAGAARSPRAK